MISIENMEFLFPSCLTSSLYAINCRWDTCCENLENYKAMVIRRVTQVRGFVSDARELILNHPVFSIFLAIVALLGFIPVFLFLSIVSGSFVVIFVTALTVFQGVVVVCLLPLLAVLVPILMIGGMAAVFAYIVYCSVVGIAQNIKRVIKAVLPSRFLGKLVRCGSYKVYSRDMPPEYHRRHEAFPSDEEPFEEELLYSSYN